MFGQIKVALVSSDPIPELQFHSASVHSLVPYASPPLKTSDQLPCTLTTCVTLLTTRLPPPTVRNGSHRYLFLWTLAPPLQLANLASFYSGAQETTRSDIRTIRRRQIHPPQTPLRRLPQHVRLQRLPSVANPSSDTVAPRPASESRR